MYIKVNLFQEYLLPVISLLKMFLLIFQLRLCYANTRTCDVTDGNAQIQAKTDVT